jgi:AcrR family transcriptional regulator
MPKQPNKPAKRARRTNEQRSSETRARLIKAAIEVLYRSGHSAATTIIIAKRAGVSRGAMLHQFRTRDQLLVAVASQCAGAPARSWARSSGSRRRRSFIAELMNRSGKTRTSG